MENKPSWRITKGHRRKFRDSRRQQEFLLRIIGHPAEGQEASRESQRFFLGNPRKQALEFLWKILGTQMS
ncbi:hypothetical protein B5F36_01535 [Anaerofilum sp. An201]|nr:hypothetical protein B5F36_01535 [Anaerofilum sp. An201]